eukprot:tig00021357_g20776.t1
MFSGAALAAPPVLRWGGSAALEPATVRQCVPRRRARPSAAGASASAFFGRPQALRWQVASGLPHRRPLARRPAPVAPLRAAADGSASLEAAANAAEAPSENCDAEAAGEGGDPAGEVRLQTAREVAELGSEGQKVLRELQETMHRISKEVATGRASRLLIGDLLIHGELGICRLEGLVRRRPEGAPADAEKEPYYKLEFADGVHYESAERVKRSGGSLLSRYIGIEGRKERLDRLAKKGGGFTKRKKQAQAAAERLARDIVRRVAARLSLRREPCPADGPRQRAFEEAFPWEPTPCQERAFGDVRGDMCEVARPMDRLICGDVGFGKTEVALRAAFRAVEAGRQVAILAPTTVLARQHFEKMAPVEGAAAGPDAVDRFSRFGVRVALLTSHQKRSERAEILRGLASGEVQVVVGTSSILSDKVVFARLGLLICDEEQRFGVEQKEKLKAMRHGLDVLTMSATPIPRTLTFALYGKQEVTLIRTPPAGRRDVLTAVGEFNEEEARTALELELARGGQVFWVVAKVAELAGAVETVGRLCPAARVLAAHGRTERLEEQMDAFRRGEADVLVCTSIIESGIDVPSANTIVIASGEHFGLASLYQLRGRVGRSTRQAYCYIYVRPGSLQRPETRQRLHEIERHTHLGDGYDLAMADLAIRGAGNLVGKEQSGHMHSVGQEAFARLVREALAAVQAASSFTPTEYCSVEIPGLGAGLPAAYAGDERDAILDLVDSAATAGEVDALLAHLAQRRGPPPEVPAAPSLPPRPAARPAERRAGRGQAVEDLFGAERLARHARALGVARIAWDPMAVRVGLKRDLTPLEREGGWFTLHAPSLNSAGFKYLQRVASEVEPGVGLEHYPGEGTLSLTGLGKPRPPHAQLRSLERLFAAVAESVESDRRAALEAGDAPPQARPDP